MGVGHIAVQTREMGRIRKDLLEHTRSSSRKRPVGATAQFKTDDLFNEVEVDDDEDEDTVLLADVLRELGFVLQQGTIEEALLIQKELGFEKAIGRYPVDWGNTG
jgi:hypothetical protein